MDKRTFKTRFMAILEEEVSGLSSVQKLKYMKKWIKEHERNIVGKQPDSQPIKTLGPIQINTTSKIGI